MPTDPPIRRTLIVLGALAAIAVVLLVAMLREMDRIAHAPRAGTLPGRIGTRAGTR